MRAERQLYLQLRCSSDPKFRCQNGSLHFNNIATEMKEQSAVQREARDRRTPHRHIHSLACKQHPANNFHQDLEAHLPVEAFTVEQLLRPKNSHVLKAFEVSLQRHCNVAIGQAHACASWAIMDDLPTSEQPTPGGAIVPLNLHPPTPPTSNCSSKLL